MITFVDTNLDSTVFTAAGNDVVIEGTPLDVQHRSTVTSYLAAPVVIHSATPVQWYDKEAATATHLHHNCQELGVDSTEARVVCVSCYAYVVITFVSLGRNTINMAKL